MKRKFALILMLGEVILASAGEGVRFYNEASDTTCISALLEGATTQHFENPEAAVAYFGLKFIDTPYVAHTLESEGGEVLTVNTGQLDCTTFAETALALGKTALEGSSSCRNYVDNLRNLRYRDGEVDGYASRLHYIVDWAVDNSRRGNLVDATPGFPDCSTMTRTIDYMSAHRDSYPALKSTAQYDSIRAIEQRYKNHQFPYIKVDDLGKESVIEAFHSGDVVAMVSTRSDLDVTHLGIVIKDDAGIPHLLHASYSNGKVELTPLPLAEFIKRNKYWIGVRVFRLNMQ